ncbi:MAG: SUMF1/EgtB/PvdO family nonheme iron enzyme [Treponema sp.]|jgi:formylglycine-generating enzyme required for sulfatase activity|nr:SUMF1/EgtB/PvdO family nonheme iron enzyme [Treponema sp.]
MKQLTFIAALALCGMAAFGQQAKLVVPPFEKRGTNLDAAALDNLQDFLINSFINTGRFQVPDRSALALLAQEQQFQLSDWADEAKGAEMGKALNADYIVRVIAMHEGEANLLMARILDVKNAYRLSSAEMEFTTQRDARGKMDAFVSDILQRISGGGRAVTRTSPRPGTGGAPKGFVLVEGGTFTMGSPSKEPDRDSDEGPRHQVTVKSFYMGKREVTQREWQELMGNNPSKFRGDTLPVEQVSWYEVIEYCNRRSVKEGLTPAYRGSRNSITCDWNASGYRLPTEAEWEYAAKGGNKNYLTYLYAGSNSAGAAGWYDGNSGGTTHPVGTKAANDLRIYDLSGNVWEWCWDWYGGYSSGAQTDPAGPVSGSVRVIRGGSGPGFPLQSFLRLLRSAKKDFRFNPLRGRRTPSGPACGRQAASRCLPHVRYALSLPRPGKPLFSNG